MANATLTLVYNISRDLAEASFDEKPEQFTGLGELVRLEIAQFLGPTEGPSVTLSSLTIT